LVDLHGKCLGDTNNPCVPDSNASRTPDAVYVRKPATYLPRYSAELREEEYRRVRGQFSNEEGFSTESSAPIEGFADTFKIIITQDYNSLPEEEPRRQFFENNMCQWIRQLIGGE